MFFLNIFSIFGIFFIGSWKCHFMDLFVIICIIEFITEDVIDSKWVRGIYRDLQIILRKLSHQKLVLFHRLIM